MRKIETQQVIDKRRSRNAQILTYTMLGILILSSLGYAFLSSDSSSNTSGQVEEGEVVNAGGYWVTSYSGQQFMFTISPEEAANISNNVLFNAGTYLGQDIYVDAENTGMFSEVYSRMQPISANIKEACYGNCTKDLPEKDCSVDKMIIWRDSLQNRVYQQNNCVFLEGDVKSLDAFMYRILEIN